METADSSASNGHSLQLDGCEIRYPQQVKSIKAKKIFKTKVLHDNPETLVGDFTSKNNRKAEQLFPGSKVAKVWCPRTSDALHLLTHAISGEPNHIIIHTGTNDLWAQQDRVADCVRRVAQAATQAFPSTKITISTILPRRDIHPATIQKINAEISRGCALVANVHLPHHPNLSIHSLHDHVHLHKDVVNTFAKNLKDVALGRSPNSPPRSNRTPSLHTATLLYPPPPRAISTHEATLHYCPLSQPQQHNCSTPRATHQTTPLHRYPRLIPAPRPKANCVHHQCPAQCTNHQCPAQCTNPQYTKNQCPVPAGSFYGRPTPLQ
ncbi:hypothetical protein SRHO_G00161440 [Serrasalmus rhombeus]